VVPLISGGLDAAPGTSCERVRARAKQEEDALLPCWIYLIRLSLPKRRDQATLTSPLLGQSLLVVHDDAFRGEVEIDAKGPRPIAWSNVSSPTPSQSRVDLGGERKERCSNGSPGPPVLQEQTERNPIEKVRIAKAK